jgi:7-cyano-7-deazaguanine synthase
MTNQLGHLEILPIPDHARGEKCVVILSGGMDSSVLLHFVAWMGMEPIAVSFNYGQKHKKELEFAVKQVDSLSNETGVAIDHKIIDLSSITPHISNSALTSDAPVPEGHYAADNMKQTVVPNRNMIMLSVAAGIAVNEGAVAIATGIHAGDHFVYPDCRPKFAKLTMAAVKAGNEGFIHEKFFLYAPFLNFGKHDIAKIGEALWVDFSDTWSCYNGRDLHCGVCGTCVERKEAFELGGVQDPTMYENTEVIV